MREPAEHLPRVSAVALFVTEIQPQAGAEIPALVVVRFELEHGLNVSKGLLEMPEQAFDVCQTIQARSRVWLEEARQLTTHFHRLAPERLRPCQVPLSLQHTCEVRQAQD